MIFQPARFARSIQRQHQAVHRPRHSGFAWAAAAFALWLSAPVLAFDLQGHRGARGLAPENTLPAFQRALSIGVHTLELDIGLTADDVVVIGHDPLLNPAIARGSSGQWIATPGPAVRSLTWAQLQAFDVGRIDPASVYAKTFSNQQPMDGTRMPRLQDLFEMVNGLGAQSVRFNIETKINPTKPEETASPETMVRELLAVVRRAGLMQRVSIQSFDWRTLRLVQELAPGVPTVYLSMQTPQNNTTRDGVWTAGIRLADHGDSVARMVKAAGGRIWSPNAGALTQALVVEAQSMGLQVIPWTVNNPADMQRLMDWGVDGLITDYPDRLRQLMSARGLPLPEPISTR